MDVQLLKRAIEWARTEDAKAERGDFCAWDQDSFAETTSCGTTMCLAGWVAHEAGLEMIWRSNSVDSTWLDRVELDCAWIDPDDAAMEVLGISTQQANRLFLMTPTNINAVEKVAQEIVAENGGVWE